MFSKDSKIILEASELARLIRQGEKNHGKDYAKQWFASQIVSNDFLYEALLELMEGR